MTGSVEPRRILFICTANICRSPTAEYLARYQFGERRLVFRSAGFLESGRPSSDTLIQALDEVGIDVRRHRSYRLDRPSVLAADLILTMEGAHVRQASELEPSAYPKTLPIKEARSLLDASGTTASVEDLLHTLAERREPAHYLGTLWDVVDPYGRSLGTYRRTVAELTELVDEVIGRLR